MANRKISEFTALTAPASTDVLPIIDQSGADAEKNKKITYANLLSKAPDGSASAPAFSFSSDTNSGISGGSDTLTLSTGGVGRLTINSAGLVTIPGDLTVAGTTTTIDTTNLTVKDKNIEIAKGNGNDAAVDGAGITVDSTDGDKTWNWVDSTDAWTSSEHIDLASGKVLKVAGTQVLSATNFTGTSAIATNVTVADESSDTTCNVLFTTAATGNLPPKTGTNLTFNSSSGALTATSFVGDLTGDVTGNVTGNTSGSSGSCTGNSATATEATNVTVSANNSTNETVYPVFVDGATGTQGAETDTGLTYNPSSGLLTSTGFAGALTGNVTGNVSGSSGSCTGNAATATALGTARTIAGVSFDGTANISLNNNAITNGAGYITATLTQEQVEDYVGGMVTGNTETGITVTYQDSDGTLDFVVGTLNQDTTGNAATATALETARTIGGVSFDGSANIDLPGVNAAGSQNTTGSAATLTTARTIAGVSFDGSANISLNNNAITNGAGYIDGSTLNASNLSSGTVAAARLSTATTQTAGDSTTKIATTAFVSTAVSNLINGAPAALDTLNELAAAMNDDAAFSTTVTNSLATKLPLAGGQITGNITCSGSQTFDGRDLSVDGSKLDGIESGATADQTKSDIDALGIAASTAATLATARTINGTSFDGSANITVTAAGSTLTGTSLKSTIVSSSLTSVGTLTSLSSGAITTTDNLAVDNAKEVRLYEADSNGSAYVGIKGATDKGSEASYTVSLPAAAPTANQILKANASTPTNLEWATDSGGIPDTGGTFTGKVTHNYTSSIRVPSGTTGQRDGSPSNGDFRYNSTLNKFEGYANSAWGEIGGAGATGTADLLDIATSSGTGGGGSTFDGSRYRFKLVAKGTSNAVTPSNAEILRVSINGVMQQPNDGTGQGDMSEGYVVDGTDIIFDSAPPSGASYFIVNMGTTIAIGTPGDNTVTSAKIVDGTIVGTDLATNVDLVDNQKIRFGTGNDLSIYHDGSDSIIQGGDPTVIRSNLLLLKNFDNSESYIRCHNNGAVELYHNNVKKFETTSAGATVTGTLTATAYAGDGSGLTGVSSQVADGCITENSQTISNNYTMTTNKSGLSAGDITIANGVTVTIPSGSRYVIV